MLHLEETVEQSDYVVFFNGKVNRDRPSPWWMSSCRDQYGQVVRFKEIPVYKIAKGKNGEMVGVEDTFTGTDGRTITKTWDQKLDFTSGRRSLKLHKIIHKDVIQTIRDLRKCVSSQKSEGLPERTTGEIIEFEPQVKKKKAFELNMKEVRAMSIVGKLSEIVEEPVFLYVCATIGTLRGSEWDKMLAITEYAKRKPDEFIDLFKEGTEQLEIKNKYIDEAIINIALGYGVIKNSNGVYNLNDMQLGTNAKRIHIDYHDNMGVIKAELDRMGVFGGTDEKKKK